jgi:hyperosmotically inducible periplasmic protein
MCAMKAAIPAFALMALLTNGCAREVERGAGEQLTNEALQQTVKTRLQSDANVSRLNLEVTADAEHRAVELQGVAYTQRQRTRAVELARSVRDGIAVEDKIDVKPYEIPRDLFDDEMMAEVKADASKMGDEVGNSLDDGWLHMKVVAKLIADSKTPERTINVDVSNSAVTLRGTVPTQESRAQAESVTKSVDGVKDVKNRLVVKQ